MSFDSIDEQRSFREKFSFPYALLSDADKQLAIACGAADAGSSYPKRITVVIGPDGELTGRDELGARVTTVLRPGDHRAQNACVLGTADGRVL